MAFTKKIATRGSWKRVKDTDVVGDQDRPGTPAAKPPRASELAGRRSVVVGLLVAVGQTIALAVAAVLTGSAAMKTQTATSLADVAVGVFLMIGVVSGDRPADDSHPLGYGRERFFWSFIAAVGIFVGGVGAAAAETLQTWLHPTRAGSYPVGYAVLAVVIVLDAIALSAGLGPLRRRAAERRVSLGRFVWRGTDPAVTTVVLSSIAGLTGGLVAAAGLAGREIIGRPALDATASAVIGLILLATSVVLLHANRELLTGRAVPQSGVVQMRDLVGARPGVVAVPDLFAIVVGPSSVIVDADVIFDDVLTVPQVEAIIVDAAAALRARWPAVAYVYLNPVAEHRPRRFSAGDRRPDESPDSARSTVAKPADGHIDGRRETVGDPQQRLSRWRDRQDVPIASRVPCSGRPRRVIL